MQWPYACVCHWPLVTHTVLLMGTYHRARPKRYMETNLPSDMLPGKKRKKAETVRGINHLAVHHYLFITGVNRSGRRPGHFLTRTMDLLAQTFSDQSDLHSSPYSQPI